MTTDEMSVDAAVNDNNLTSDTAAMASNTRSTEEAAAGSSNDDTSSHATCTPATGGELWNFELLAGVTATIPGALVCTHTSVALEIELVIVLALSRLLTIYCSYRSILSLTVPTVLIMYFQMPKIQMRMRMRMRMRMKL